MFRGRLKPEDENCIIGNIFDFNEELELYFVDSLWEFDELSIDDWLDAGPGEAFKRTKYRPISYQQAMPRENFKEKELIPSEKSYSDLVDTEANVECEYPDGRKIRTMERFTEKCSHFHDSYYKLMKEKYSHNQSESTDGTCQQRFIRVDEFTLQHLPDNYRTHELFSAINNLIGLTSYNISSSSNGTQTFITQGSGRVADVIQHKGDNKETCPCKDCVMSESPSEVWWNVRVHTAASLISENDHESIQCVLFYDSLQSQTVHLSDGQIVFIDRERDVCFLNFPTCNKNLSKKLGKMVDDFNDQYGRLKLQYMKYEDPNKLAIIVSHPHGCPKHVSVGQLLDGCQKEEKVKRYQYNNDLCDGSTGAFVFVLGNS